MKKVLRFLIPICTIAVLLILGYGYYRYTNYYYGNQVYAECDIITEEDSYTFSGEGMFSIPVTVKNPSRVALTESNRYYLSYHLLDASGNMLDIDGAWTPLNVNPFRNESVSMNFIAPQPGSYQMKIDILRDGYYWHEDLGGKTTTISVTINE